MKFRVTGTLRTDHIDNVMQALSGHFPADRLKVMSSSQVMVKSENINLDISETVSSQGVIDFGVSGFIDLDSQHGVQVLLKTIAMQFNARQIKYAIQYQQEDVAGNSISEKFELSN